MPSGVWAFTGINAAVCGSTLAERLRLTRRILANPALNMAASLPPMFNPFETMKTTVPILFIHLEPETIPMKNTESPFGEVIYAYTRKQAIADGFQVVPPKPSRDGEEVLNTLREAGLPFFQTVIRRYKVFQKAALDGVLVKDVADLHAADAWADYKAIAGEVLR